MAIVNKPSTYDGHKVDGENTYAKFTYMEPMTCPGCGGRLLGFYDYCNQFYFTLEQVGMTVETCKENHV